jgi:AcrR family transcriptional regulator
VEASVRPQHGERKLESEKAQRIVAAMRESVGTRGAAGATFDHVARAAGVSRGLLHYYFGSKERLLVEVVRHDTELRIATLERNLAPADSLDAVVEVLVTQVRSFLAEDPASQAVIYEMFSASRHNEELRIEMAALYRQIRDHIAEALRQKHESGVLNLRDEPENVASVLLALGDGITMQLISDPDWDSDAAFELGVRTARFLLGSDE